VRARKRTQDLRSEAKEATQETRLSPRLVINANLASNPAAPASRRLGESPPGRTSIAPPNAQGRPVRGRLAKEGCMRAVIATNASLTGSRRSRCHRDPHHPRSSLAGARPQARMRWVLFIAVAPSGAIVSAGRPDTPDHRSGSGLSAARRSARWPR
jgi:hypothetical protein